MDLHDLQNDVVSCILLVKQILIYDDVDHDFQIGFFLVIDFLNENLTKINILTLSNVVIWSPSIVFVFETSRLMIQIFSVFCYGYLTGIYSGTFLLSLAFLIYKVSLGNGLVFYISIIFDF